MKLVYPMLEFKVLFWLEPAVLCSLALGLFFHLFFGCITCVSDFFCWCFSGWFVVLNLGLGLYIPECSIFIDFWSMVVGGLVWLYPMAFIVLLWCCLLALNAIMLFPAYYMALCLSYFVLLSGGGSFVQFLIFGLATCEPDGAFAGVFFLDLFCLWFLGS